jgi:hypothetical protein
MATATRSLGALALLAALTLAGISEAGATTTTTTVDPAQANATALVSGAVAVANQQSSVHYVAVSSMNGKSITLTADAASEAGQQTIVIKSGKSVGHVTALLVDDAAYFMGDRFGLVEYLGMTSAMATKYRSQWIEFTPSDSSFSQIQQSFTIAAAIAQISLEGPYTVRSTACAAGSCQSVRGVTTTLSTKGKKSSATLFVQATGQSLPVRFQGNAPASATLARGAIDFSNWGEAVSPTAPQGAILASTIAGS